MAEAVSQMEYQQKIGIQVYYIEKGNEYIDLTWLLEDYLIQGDELPVQIYCKSHQFSTQAQDTEEITMDTVQVQRRAERFQRILERATKYEPTGDSGNAAE